MLSAIQAASREPLKIMNARQATVYRTGRGRIVHSATLPEVEVLAAAMQDLDVIRFTKNDLRLDVTVHRPLDHSDKRVIVFVANPSADSIDAQVGLSMDLQSVKEIWEERPISLNQRMWSDSASVYDQNIRVYLVA